MALTNFAALTSEQKTVWSREVWEDARDAMFFNKFVGSSAMSVIQRITELTKTEKGELVIMHLLADLVEDGVVGDDEREGNEEEMKSYNDTITIDLISHGVRQKGKLAEQKTVIKFRENARDRLSYWLSNRLDQLMFQTLAGWSYSLKPDGSARTSGAFASLAFSADVSAATTNRHYNVVGSGAALAAGNTATITTAATLTYDDIVNINVEAKTKYMKPLKSGGKEYYVAFVRPEALAQLKKDADFQNALVNAQVRGDSNPIFTGANVTVDGMILHEHRLVPNTKGSGATQWGAGANVDGAVMLVCGAQALGMADLGQPEWSEKWFNYDSSPGVNVDKMFGLLKPKFYNTNTASIEDFGVMRINHAI